jgi:ERCC4-type nuclease
MSPFEVQQALNTMTILVDTREQNTPALQQRLESMGCQYERYKLDYGDYSAKVKLPQGELNLARAAVVERKMNFGELCQCYCQNRKRFEREFERAKADGAKVYLLVENGSWEAAYAGRYRSKMQPKALVASMTAWLARYNCQLLFCHPLTTGKLIREVLYRELKERLERDDFGQ